MAFCLPALPSSRLPQSVQKTREPIADMVSGCLLASNVVEIVHIVLHGRRGTSMLKVERASADQHVIT
jgi:hypothetical protein